MGMGVLERRNDSAKGIEIFKCSGVLREKIDREKKEVF